MTTGSTIALLAVLVIVVVPALALIVSYNRFVSQRNLIDSAWSGVDVELTRRHDLIPNLINTVKGYAAHEKELLNELTAAREAAVALEGNGTPEQRRGPEEAINGALAKIIARAEAYPDLKANTNFLHLQQELAGTEDRIAAARRFYNNNVAAYNTRVGSVPSNVVASMFTFGLRELFQLRDPSVAEVPVVDFGATPPPTATF